jgi:crotonobetainyl-CoA:carnitine CoA-transferase CaiB-like acyl-CoA transferase
LSPRSERLPLAGVMVLDFTAFWAGPSATRSLADLGAFVIWVERPGSRVDVDLMTSDASTLVQHVFHLKMNRNKQSVVLDLSDASDQEIARRLARQADVLVENFRPGVMNDLGLGPSQLCRSNPGLVYVSLSGFGASGPWSERRSYGPTIEAASSIEGRTGYAGGEPLRLGHTLPDGAGGLVGALAALRGLRERSESGTGGWFDISQLEVYTAVSGEDLLAASMSGQPIPRIGNRSRCGSVQGVFRCRGDDEWIAIRLADQWEVERLAEVAGIPSLVEAAMASPRDGDAVERIINSYTTPTTSTS